MEYNFQSCNCFLVLYTCIIIVFHYYHCFIAGHTKSWGAAFRELLTICFEPLGYFPDGRYGPVNPIAEFTYKFMQKLFNEISQVFPDKYIHIGGDEVDFDCW